MQPTENTITKTTRYEDKSGRADNGRIKSTITLSVLIALQFVWFFILGGVFYGYIDSVKSLNMLKVNFAQAENRLTVLADHINRLDNSLAYEIKSRKAFPNSAATTPEISLLTEPPQSSITSNQSVQQMPPGEARTKTPAIPSLRKKAQNSAQYHEVNHGETLYQISKRYNIAVDEICRLNNLRENQPILPGQKLIFSPRKDSIVTQ